MLPIITEGEAIGISVMGLSWQGSAILVGVFFLFSF